MKKRTKFLLALLSVATMTAGVMGITACKKSGSTGGTSAKQVYDQYVTYTQAQGQEPMTYDQWLETITGQLFIKGDPGVPGTPGTPGKPGEDGATIETIDISEDGKYLVITYTDGRTPDRVKLPDTISHVHTYGEEYTVLIPQTDSAHDGLAYKVCKDKNCDHVELVVLKKSYDVTVTMDGKPAAGIPVTINGATAVSDEYGVAKVTDFGELNDYIVTVGEGYTLTTSSAKRTGKSGNNLDITVAKVFDSEGSTLVVNKDGKYGVTFKVINNYGPDTNPIPFKISADETAPKKFKLTLSDMAGVIRDGNQNQLLYGAGNTEIIVNAGETKNFEFYVDGFCLPPSVNIGDDYMLEVVVEELEAPAMGAEKETAFSVTAGETVDVVGNDAVYYVWRNPSSNIYAVQFTLNNATAEFYAYDSWMQATPVTVGAEKITLVEGEDASYAAKPYYVKVTPTGDNASFSFDTVAIYGSPLAPKTAELGENSFGGQDGAVGISHWFKFTVPAGGGNYVLEPVSGSITYGQSTSGGSSTDSKKAVALNEGDYYFNVYTDGTACSFKIREFTEADYGMSVEFAKTVTLTDNTATAQVAAGTPGGYVYFKVVASKAGTLRATPANGNTVYVGTSGLNSSMEVTEGQEVILRAAVSNVEYSFEVAVLSDEELAADHTFTVYCNSAPVAGATVTVKVGDEDLTAQTDAEGKATIRFIPGSYSLSVAKDGYFYDRTETGNATSTSESKNSYTLNLRDDSKEFTFNVSLPSGGGAIEGAEIVVKTTAGDVVASGTTDASGVYKADLFILSSGDYKYTVTLPDSVTGYAFTAVQTSEFIINHGTAQAINLSPEEIMTFTITVELPDGTKVEGVKVNVHEYDISWYPDIQANDDKGVRGSATTGADGVAVIESEKFYIMAGMNGAGIVLENLPKGYTSELTFISATPYTLKITLIATGETDPDNPDNPDNPDDPKDKVIKGAAGANGAADAALAVGENEISNANADGYYKFTAEAAGEYKFVVNDQAKKGFIKYLSAGSGLKMSEYKQLIKDGNEVDVSYNLVLGDIRDVDKAYIFTVTLKADESVIIGYNTADAAATAKINVTFIEDESGEPDEPETPVITLTEGENVIDLSNGPVFVTFNVGESNYFIEWEAEDVVLYDVVDGTVDQESSYGFEEGAGMPAMFGSEFTFLVTATSSTTVTLVVAPALW